MVRGKTQMKRIENASSRQVTFSKRRNGLLKKAYELSLLCDAEVGLVIFSATGRLSEFASPSMQKMLEKYQTYSQESGTSNTTNQQDTQYMKQEITNMEERISILESSQRNMVGDSLESCSMKELTKLESQVEKGLSHIRAWKTKLLVDRIEFLERKLGDSQYEDDWVLTTPPIRLGSMQHSEVETQLVMRPPDIHSCLPMHNSI